MTAILLDVAQPAASGAFDGFEVSYSAGDGGEHRASLASAWAAPFEVGLPVRRFAAHKGHEHLTGLWWSAAIGRHMGFESRFEGEVGRLIGQPVYWPPEQGDAIAHWKFDSRRPPSRPTVSYPDTRRDGSSHNPKASPFNTARRQRSALWFARSRRGGRTILHHRHIQPVLCREWSPRMDGITASIWASRATAEFDDAVKTASGLHLDGHHNGARRSRRVET